jgi:UBX domain-containing protein 1
VPGDIQPAVKAASSNSAAAQAAINQPQVDPSKPHTSLQLRLQDGSRLVAQLNMTHTIGDLRAFIDSNSAQRSSAYQLQTQFPTRTLDDNSKTLADYGLQNAVIFQKAA